MSNQHSLIALDWLMPILQDTFDKLTGLLQQRNGVVDLPAVADFLHQISGALTLAQQKYLAMLAAVLEKACIAILNEKLPSQYQPDIEKSVALLYYELRQFQQIQRLYTLWVVERINFFNNLLGEDPVVLTPTDIADNNRVILTTLSPATHQLGDAHKYNIQKMWRYHTLQLLNTNQNTPESLQKMAEVANFLTMSISPEGYRRVWHLVELWATSQLLNEQPTPHAYYHLLDSLDRLIIDKCEPTLLTACVAVDVLLHLSQLANKSDEAAALLTPLHLQDNDKTENLFKKALAKLEKAIYQLHQPAQVLPLVQEVKTLLTNRGWLLYESYLAQVIADLQMMVDDPSQSDALYWQVERQLQELYSQLLETANTLESKTRKVFEHTTPIYDDEGETLAISQTKTPAVAQIFPTSATDEADFDHAMLNFRNDKLPTTSQSLVVSTSEIPHPADFEPLIVEAPQLEETALKQSDTKISEDIATTEIAVTTPTSSVTKSQEAQSHVANEVESEALQAARALLKPDSSDVDAEIREIFIEEAQEVLESLDSELPRWKANPHDLAILKDIRRGFHTLKGSGRMVGAFWLGETAWSVENMLNRVLDGTLEATPEVVAFIVDTRENIPTLLQDFENQQTPSIDPALIILQANNLLKHRPRGEGMPTAATITAETQTAPAIAIDTFSADPSNAYTIYEEADESELVYAKTLLVETLPAEPLPIEPAILSAALKDTTADLKDSTPLSVSTTATTSIMPTVVQAELDSMTWAEDSESDPDIQEIYIEEAQEVLETIAPQFDIWQKNPSDMAALKELRRGFHTLKGSGRMVGANQLGELGWTIENMLNRVLDTTIEPRAGLVTLVGDVIYGFAPLLDIFAQNRTDYPQDIKVWAATANAYSKKHGDSIDYPHFLAADAQATTVAVPTIVGTTTIESADIPSVSMPPTIPQPVEPAASISTPILPTPQDIDDDTLMFEDDPSEDAEDDNYVGNNYVSNNTTRAYITTQTPVINTEEVSHSESNDSLTIPLHAQPDRLSDEDVIGHVFLEESTELLHKIGQFIQTHRHDEHTYVSDDLVRAFHTLRGGAALSELPRVYALSAALENSLDELLRNEIPLTSEQLYLLEGAKADLENYIGDYKTAKATQSQPQDVNDIAQLTSQLLDENSQKPNHAMSVTQLMDLGIDDLLDGDTQLRVAFTNSPNSNTPSDTSFNLETLTAYLQKMYQQAGVLLTAVANTKFAGLVQAMHQSYGDLLQYPEFCQDEEVIEAFESLHAQLIHVLDNIAAGMNITWNQPVVTYLDKLLASKKYHARLLAMVYDTPQTDVELLDIFVQEAMELDQRMHQIFTRWQNNLTSTSYLAETRDLCHAVHTLKGGARMVGLNSIGELSHATETVYEAIANHKLASSAEIADILQQVQDTISAQLRLLKNETHSFFATSLAQQLSQIVATGSIPAGMVADIPVIVHDKRHDSFDNEINTTPILEEIQTPTAIDDTYSQEIVNNFAQRRLNTWHGQEPDEDLLAVFLEEAKELIDSSIQHLQDFRSNTSDISALQALQRELHTIKGGARMVGAEGLANLAHEMETIYEDLSSRRKPATRMIGNLLATCHDWLASALFVLENKYNPQTPQPLIDALLQFSKNPDSLKTIPQASLAQQIEQIETYQTSLLQVQEDNARDLSVMPPMLGNFATEQEQNSLNAEMIRISSNLIERMINLSGESAINRARIDMQVSSLTTTIEEMGMTVQRLADQLRRMETELEIQVLAQIDDERLLATDFDPLEMDQYSSLNQLSKSLSESASDLLDIKTTMLDKTRDTENLLLQLSRTQTELQEGLMKSRMVPFSRVTPRLQRIVRQTANELSKSVELRILNDDNEVDRNILDRITSPLEHMIRNAVDHGIERTQERIENGKSRTGLITLDLVREGGEIVIYLTDDGKGINVDAVRNKAIEQGLINAEDTSLTPVDIMQYIFSAGLSTSTSVTQISGRGVGMDVVQSEVKQLGGVVSVDSEAGQGSRFILRLPLTVAVTDALIVKAGDKQFAVPLVQIERVMRVSAETIYAFHNTDATTLEIDGQDYRLRYLNQILFATNPLESLRYQTASVPVIIIRNETGQRLALQVDAIAGSRVEVVVKPLGRQLSHIAGISSATIMGDGSVMLILDLIALMRNAINAIKIDKHKTVADVVKPMVLIIDDSVTVRKVTTRLLERNGFETQIAKDGVDALDILQSLTPDIILLDIEMPRMDGFEVANQVRHNSRLKGVPIIMITSRTGEKHRERAMSIGVNAYMGKPFQEQDLLENIKRLLNQKVIT